MGGSDEDIINDVCAKHLVEINRVDDNEEEDTVMEKGCREAVASSLTLQKYINDIDKPKITIVNYFFSTQHTKYTRWKNVGKNRAIVKPHTLR